MKDKMKLKEKLLNAIADKLSEHKTPEYDYMENINIVGKIKGVYTTNSGSCKIMIDDKEENGVISMQNLLNKEVKTNDVMISLCDKENALCFQDNSKHKIIKLGENDFEDAYEVTYLLCDSKTDYNNVKLYLNQNSKYYTLINDVDDIPYNSTFKSLFAEKIEQHEEVREDVNDKTLEEKEKYKENYMELVGKVLSIGKEYERKDKVKAQFINIEQKYDYNGSEKVNNMSIILEDKMLEKYKNKIKENDTISVKGNISTYKDKNNQERVVINCNELNILSTEKER